MEVGELIPFFESQNFENEDSIINSLKDIVSNSVDYDPNMPVVCDCCDAVLLMKDNEPYCVNELEIWHW